jgi:hypothetical protein
LTAHVNAAAIHFLMHFVRAKNFRVRAM